MGKAKVLTGGNTAIVNSEVIQGYSLYETLKAGTFVTKADSSTIALASEDLTEPYACMITPTLGILFWYKIQQNAGSWDSDIYTSYARAFKVEKGIVQWGTTLTYKSTSYEYSRILDTLPITDNRLLAVHVYGESVKSGTGSTPETNCNLVAQYFTVNSDLSITVSTELILKTSYSYSFDAFISKAPNGKVYVAFEQSGSYNIGRSTYYNYYLAICLLDIGTSAPTLITTAAVIDQSNYYPISLIAFEVLSNTSAILHYNTTKYKDESAYAKAITLSGNSITMGTSTYLSYSSYGFSFLYSLFKYSSSQAMGLMGDGSFAVLLTATTRTKVTVSEALAWVGYVGSELYCLTKARKICKCTISGTTLTVGEVLAELTCPCSANNTHALVTVDRCLALTTAQEEAMDFIPYQFSEYLYRIGKTYKATTKRGTTFGITASKLQTTTLGKITTIKEVS